MTHTAGFDARPNTDVSANSMAAFPRLTNSSRRAHSSLPRTQTSMKPMHYLDASIPSFAGAFAFTGPNVIKPQSQHVQRLAKPSPAELKPDVHALSSSPNSLRDYHIRIYLYHGHIAYVVSGLRLWVQQSVILPSSPRMIAGQRQCPKSTSFSLGKHELFVAEAF